MSLHENGCELCQALHRKKSLQPDGLTLLEIWKMSLQVKRDEFSNLVIPRNFIFVNT